VKELVKIYKDRGTEFIGDLFNEYVVITEKLSGSSFSFQKEGYNLYFYKGDNRKPINLIDRTLMVYYEPAISYISSLSPDVFEGVPDNWRFGFQYFVHNAPGAITYDKLPKNNLVLTHILVKDEKGKNAKVIEDPRIIKDWAERLNVTPMQPIFQGHLDERQKKKLLNFIEVPVEDQMELFGTTSFVAYIIKCLNPSINSTTLHTDLSKPIDSIIFKFYKPGSTQTFSAKMVDPYARSLMKEKQPIDIRRAPADINEIVLLDILAFLEERGLKKHEVLSHSPEEKYLELISALFNDYVEKRGDDLQKLDFQKADFAKGPEFDVNLDLIRNEKTKKFIGGSEALKDLFKVMLGSLRKKRNPEKEGALFTKSIIVDFNKMVEKIKDITKEEGDGKFKTFEDYINLKRMNEELYIKDDLLEMIFEEQVLNYADFVNINKFNVNEALRVPHKNQGKRKVNMFAGRFQPFTTGHIKVLEDLHKQNGLPVMVMIVRGSKRDPKRTPFDEDAQQRMVAALQSQYPFIEGSVVVPNGAIDTMFSSLRPTYEPVLWGYGTDRKKSYDGQIQHDSYRAQLGVLPEFQGHEIRRGDEDVSASKVRNALERDDRKGYEKLVPRSLHDFYDELQNIMVPIEEGLLNEEDRKAGDVWKTGTGFRGQNAKGDRKTFKSKEQTQEWVGAGKEEKGEDSTFDIKKIDKKENPAAHKLASKLEKIEDPKQRKKAEEVVESLSEYENAKTDTEKKKALENLIAKGGINRNSPGTDTNKIYMGQSDEFEGSGDNRINKETGLPYNKALTESQMENILEDAEKLGVVVPMNKKANRTGGKRLAPTNIHTDSKGNKPKAIPVKVNKIEPKGKPGDKDYDPGGVKLGGENGVVMKNTPPMTKEQRSQLKEKYKKAKPDATNEELDRYVDVSEEFRRQNNEKIKKLQEKELTIIPILDENDKEIDVFTKDGQKKAVKAVGNNVVNKIDDLLAQPPKVPVSPSLRKGLDEFKQAADGIAEGKISEEEFKEKMNNLLLEMDNDPHTRPGMPDMVETFAMMEDLSQGRASVSPDAANFPLGDVITFDPAELPPDATPEETIKHINIMLTSSGTRSIKYEKGGASQSGNKIIATEYADFGDIKGTEIKSDLQDLTSKQYDNIFNVQEKPPFKGLDRVQNNAKHLAQKYDVDLKEEGLDPLSDKRKARYERRANKAMVKNVIEEFKEKGIDLSEDEAKEMLIKRWTAMDMNGEVMEQVNNKQQMSQGFTNRSYNTDPANAETSNPDNPDVMKEDGKPVMLLDTEGNPRKDKKGKILYRRKQKMKIKETNGISDLACMKYSSDPGFSKTGKPNNKMPANVINCEEGNTWLGD